MSESEMITIPTLDTILERINTQGAVMQTGFGSIGQQLEGIGQRLERIEIRLDRVESMVLDVRADFREFRAAIKEPA